MAAYINVFIETAQPLKLLAGTVGAIVGKELVVDSLDVGPVFRTRVMGIDIIMFDNHGLEDDRDMHFTRYSIQLDLGPLAEEQHYDQLVCAVGINLARRISSRLECPTMVTEDLQRVIHTCSS